MLFTKNFLNKVMCSGILSYFLYTCHTRNGSTAQAKSFPTKKFFFQSVAKMESAVRETLASILSWFPSFTRPVIRRSPLFDRLT